MRYFRMNSKQHMIPSGLQPKSRPQTRRFDSSLKPVLKKNQQKFNALQTAKESLQKDYDTARDELQDANTKLAETNTLVATLHENLEQQKSQMATMTAQRQEVETKLSETSAQLAEQIALLAASNKQIEELQQIIAAKKQQILSSSRPARPTPRPSWLQPWNNWLLSRERRRRVFRILPNSKIRLLKRKNPLQPW